MSRDVSPLFLHARQGEDGRDLTCAMFFQQSHNFPKRVFPVAAFHSAAGPSGNQIMGPSANPLSLPARSAR